MTRLALLAALLVAACAAVPPAAIPLDGLPATFEMGGRLSVAQSGRGEILRLRWSHGPLADTWVLATPVGTEVARIERRPEGLVAFRPGAAPVSANSFADLTQDVLGAPLDERLSSPGCTAGRSRASGPASMNSRGRQPNRGARTSIGS